MIRILFISLFLFFSLISFKKKQQPNFLFICVDDLRPELGFLGTEAITPSIDSLFKHSTYFKNHFVVVPTCGASRYALLTGQYPRERAAISNNASSNLMKKRPSPESFVHELKNNNYYTVGIGKISHYPDGRVYDYDKTPENAPLELPNSWNEMLFNAGKWKTGHNAFFGYADGTNRTDLKKQVKPYEMADVVDTGYPDGLSANLAIEKLDEMPQPFFLGLGFIRPHLPFNSPKKYWDLYEEADLKTSVNQSIPENLNRKSLHGSGEFNQYALGEEKASLDSAMSIAYQKKLRHAYLASISYIDAQIGKVLQALEEKDLAENTVVVIWGDHGWHLGDQRVWGKHTLLDEGLKSPLLIYDPRKNKPSIIDEVVSSVDIYPTLLDMANIKPSTSLDGQSLVPFVKKGKESNWRNTAYSYYRNGITVRTPTKRLGKYYSKEPYFDVYEVENNRFVKGISDKEIQLIEKGNLGLY